MNKAELTEKLIERTGLSARDARAAIDAIFDPVRATEGRRAIVTFADGETMWGAVTEDDPAVPGFFFVPSDVRDNNVKIFVVRKWLKELRWAP